MAEYKKLDLSKLNFQPSSKSFDEIVSACPTPSESVLKKLCDKSSNIKIEKDYTNKCVKLEILS